MKPVLRNILLGGLTLGLGKAIYEKGKQDERKELKNGLNEVLAQQRLRDLQEESKKLQKAEKKAEKNQMNESK